MPALKGDSFKLVYTFDLRQGTLSSYLQQLGPGEDNDILGGVGFIGPASAALTIGDRTITFDGNGGHTVDWDYEDFLYLPTDKDYLNSADGIFQISTQASSFAIPLYVKIDTPFSFDVASTLVDPGGRFKFLGAGMDTSGAFSGLEVSLTSTAPEPSTWIYFLGGFGMMGLVFRKAHANSGRNALAHLGSDSFPIADVMCIPS